jgi:hypothetical protein
MAVCASFAPSVRVQSVAGQGEDAATYSACDVSLKMKNRHSQPWDDFGVRTCRNSLRGKLRHCRAIVARRLALYCLIEVRRSFY